MLDRQDPMAEYVQTVWQENTKPLLGLKPAQIALQANIRRQF